MKKTLKIKDYKIVVFGEDRQGRFVALRFDVYYRHRKVNGILRQKTVDLLEEAINDYFNGALLN